MSLDDWSLLHVAADVVSVGSIAVRSRGFELGIWPTSGFLYRLIFFASHLLPSTLLAF